MEKYLKLVPNNANRETTLKVSTGYDLGGISWFSHEERPRGYYLYAVPMTIIPRDDGKGGTYDLIENELGKGLRLLLKEVKRQSKKAAAEAEVLAEQEVDWIVNAVCRKYGLVLKPEWRVDMVAESVRKPLRTGFDSEDEATAFAETMSWEYWDENGFAWNLEVAQ